MSGQILTKLGGRDIMFRDEMGLVHRCKGFASGKRRQLFWTHCHLDAPEHGVHGQARHEAVTCPDCLAVASEPARRILAADAVAPRPAVGGPPFKLDPD